MSQKTVAELVNDLFDTHRKPDGREYSVHEVARGINGQLTGSYIAKLRRGEVKNPGRNALLLLCQFFDVPSSYFFPELDPPTITDEELNEVIARRVADLTPEARRRIADLLDILRRKR